MSPRGRPGEEARSTEHVGGPLTASPAELLPRAAAWVFASFAFAYFFSALLRAVTATLAPVFSAELGLGSADLGLLAGAYFLGFALLQLPMGVALDRHGPKRVLLVLLSVAVVGCVAFALAQGFATLIVARILIGVGVSACLMAPLTCFRHRFTDIAQLRANSWMLMTGSLGMVASTLPVQAVLPLLGWRGLFWAVAVALLLAMLALARWVPRDEPYRPAKHNRTDDGGGGYGQVFRHPMFVALLPLGFFVYGGVIAVQALWAGPWLTLVAGYTAAQAAAGLFAINLSMLLSFLGWGLLMPRLQRHGWDASRLIARGLPLSLLLLAVLLWRGAEAGAAWWAAWCVSCTVITLSQPALAQAFAPTLAGRALSAFNLVIFLGVFCIQWGIGLAVDWARTGGLAAAPALRLAFALHGLCCVLAYGWFRWRTRQAARLPATTADNLR